MIIETGVDFVQQIIHLLWEIQVAPNLLPTAFRKRQDIQLLS
jgi:hypothetical protein